MKSFSLRTMFPVLGVVAVLAGCSGAEAADTGTASTAIAATSEGQTPEDRLHAGRPHRAGGPNFLVSAALRENIGLTAEQRSTIEGLVQKDRKAHEKGARPSPDKAKAVELAAAIRSGNVDTSKVAARGPNRDGAPSAADRQAKSAAKLATLHDTLTTEQRAALVDAIAAKRAQRLQAGPGAEGRPDGKRRGPEGRRGGPMGHLFEGLDLTQAQKEQIKAKFEANRPAPPSEADRAARKTAMSAKLQSFKADSFDADAFVAPPANAPKMGGPRGPAHMAKGLSTVVSVLTADQREKLAQKIEQGPPARR